MCYFSNLTGSFVTSCRFSRSLVLSGSFSLSHGPWTMGKGHLMIHLSWSDILKNHFTKLLGLSLGVQWMWTKWNDHAPKSKCYYFFLYMSKKSTFGHNLLSILLPSLHFSYLFVLFVLILNFNKHVCKTMLYMASMYM